MNGHLSAREAVATVARRVRQLEAQGLDRDRAIQQAAARYRIDPERAGWCADLGPATA